MNFADFGKIYICSRAAKLLLRLAMVEIFHKNIIKHQPLPNKGIGNLALTMRWVGVGVLASAPMVKFR